MAWAKSLPSSCRSLPSRRPMPSFSAVSVNSIGLRTRNGAGEKKPETPGSRLKELLHEAYKDLDAERREDKTQRRLELLT